jgi:hypothetical protein
MGPYPVAAIVRARELHTAGWKPGEIRRLIEREFGRRPAWRTVQGWVDEDAAERMRGGTRKAQRARLGRLGRRPFRAISEELQIERMQALYDRGLSLKAIGQVAAVWWGEELSAERVKTRLGLNGQTVRSISERAA